MDPFPPAEAAPAQALISSATPGEVIASVYLSLGGWLVQPDAMRSSTWLSFADQRVGPRGWLIRLGGLAFPRRLSRIICETRRIERLDLMAVSGSSGTAVFITHDLSGRRGKRVERILSGLEQGEVHPALERGGQKAAARS